jgi:hypothetical protein
VSEVNVSESTIKEDHPESAEAEDEAIESSEPTVPAEVLPEQVIEPAKPVAAGNDMMAAFLSKSAEQ